MHMYTDLVNQFMEWVRNGGWVGMVWFVMVFSLTSATFLPASFLTLGAGAIYGVGTGSALVAVGSTLGAMISFATSRYFARDWMERKFGRDPRFLALEKAVGAEGWRIILISRISPILPHTIVSYASGLTRISFWRFTNCSFVGFLPLTIVYTYLGDVLGTAAGHGARLQPQTPLGWACYIGGLIVTIVVLVMMSRAAGQAWKECVTDPAKAAEVEKTS